MKCPDENIVAEFVEGLLDAAKHEAVESHMDRCPSCRRLLAGLVKTSISQSPVDDADPTEVDFDVNTESIVANADVRPGQVLAGRYRVVRLIGSGSMGSVYEVVDLQLREHIALKLLRNEVCGREHLHHVHHEVVLGRRISHPNVCRLHDIGTYGSTRFISMALVCGESLAQYLERGAPSDDARVSILSQIAAALDAAHECGVVHRDLKPSNIMIGDDLVVTVMDFGLARDLLEERESNRPMLVGTPAYWSPEQARGERATPASDLYALGVIGCELFGLSRPTHAVVPDLGSIRGAYAAILGRCLERDPHARWRSAKELSEALAHAKGAPLRHSLLRAITHRAVPLAAVAGAAFLAFGGIPALVDEMHAPSSATATALVGSPPPPAPTSSVVDSIAPAPTAPLPTEIAGPIEAPAEAHARQPTSTAPRAVRTLSHPRASATVIPGREPAREETSTRDTAIAEERERAVVRTEDALGELEQMRIARGILPGDIASWTHAIARARAQAHAGQFDAASTTIAELTTSLDRIRIDEPFIAAKLERLGRSSKERGSDNTRELEDAFANVHARYFEGDYEAANAHLNAISALLEGRRFR